MINHGRCTYILKKIFSLSNMVDKVCHGSKVNHINTCKDGVMLDHGIILQDHTMIYKMFHLTLQCYMVVSWWWHGFQMVNHHIILSLTLIQTWLTMFQLCSQQLGKIEPIPFLTKHSFKTLYQYLMLSTYM